MSMDATLSSWADDLFLHGARLAEWIVDYVDLEESLAVGTLAQEQLAHARELLTADGWDPVQADRRLYDRPAADWAPSLLAAEPLPTWPEVVCTGLLLTRATLSVLTEGIAAQDDSELSEHFAEVRSEQDLHLMHWQRWTRLLAAAESTAEEIEVELRRRADACVDLLGVVAEDTETDSPDWLIKARESFAAGIRADLADTGLDLGDISVDRARRRGEHVALIADLLDEPARVRSRYPSPVLDPR